MALLQNILNSVRKKKDQFNAGIQRVRSTPIQEFTPLAWPKAIEEGLNTRITRINPQTKQAIQGPTLRDAISQGVKDTVPAIRQAYREMVKPLPLPNNVKKVVAEVPTTALGFGLHSVARPIVEGSYNAIRPGNNPLQRGLGALQAVSAAYSPTQPVWMAGLNTTKGAINALRKGRNPKQIAVAAQQGLTGEEYTPLGSSLTDNPVLSTALNVAEFVGPFAYANRGRIAQAGKQAVRETKKNTLESFLNDALATERKIVSADGVQMRQSRGRFGSKTQLPKAIGTGEPIHRDIPLILVEFPDGRGLRIPPSKLLDDSSLIPFVKGPANPAAQRLYRQAFSGGFIKPDEFLMKDESVPRPIKILATLNGSETPEEVARIIKQMETAAFESGDRKRIADFRKAIKEYKKSVVTGRGYPRNPEYQSIFDEIDRIEAGVRPTPQINQPKVSDLEAEVVKPFTPSIPDQARNQLEDLLLSKNKLVNELGYPESVADKIGVREASRIIETGMRYQGPQPIAEVLKKRKLPFGPPEDGLPPKRNLPRAVQPSEAADAEAQTYIGEAFGQPGNLLSRTRGLPDQLRGSFENWVNARRSTEIEGVVAKRKFKDLDQEGVNGILRFQKDPNSIPGLRDWFNAKHAELNAVGVDTRYKLDYLPQMWMESADEVQQKLGRKLGLKPSFTLSSMFKSYQEGMEAGLTPRYNNISDLVGWYERTSNKAIADRQFFDYLTTQGFILPKTEAPAHWKIVDENHFPSFTVQVGEKDTYTGAYKAPPELAVALNNYLQQSSEVLQKTAGFAGTLKNAALSAGVPGTGFNAHGVNMIVRNTLASKNPISAFGRGLMWAVNPKQAEKYLDANLDKAAFFSKHGLTISAEEKAFTDPEVVEEITGSFKKIKKLRNILKGAQEKFLEDPLFKRLLPGLKLHYTDQIFEEFKRSMPEDQAAREASKVANNIFGGMNLDEIGRDKNFQNVLRSLILAPDWAESNIRVGKNVAASTFNPKNWSKPELAPYRNFARNLVAAYVSANMMNKLASGKWMWENDSGQEFSIDTGTYTPEGKKRYVNPFGTAVDFIRVPVRIASGAIKGDPTEVFRTVRNRLSLPAGMTATFLANKDRMGNAVYGKNQYGQPFTPLQNVLNVGAEIAGGTVSPYARVPLDYAGGKYSAEEAIMAGTELPVYYRGGAFSQKQKDKVEGLKEKGSTGEEIFNELQKGRAKEKKAVGATLDDIVGSASASEATYSKKPTSDGGAMMSNLEKKHLTIDSEKQREIKDNIKNGVPVSDTELIAAYLGKEVVSTARNDKLGRVLRENALFKKLDSIENDENLSDQQKERLKKFIFGKTGYTAEDAEYYDIAKIENTEAKTAYILDNLPSDRAGQIVYILDGLRPVAGKSLISDAVLTSLYEEGILSKEEANAFKKYTWDKKTNSPVVNRSIREAKVKGGTSKQTKLLKEILQTKRADLDDISEVMRITREPLKLPKRSSGKNVSTDSSRSPSKKRLEDILSTALKHSRNTSPTKRA